MKRKSKCRVSNDLINSLCLNFVIKSNIQISIQSPKLENEYFQNKQSTFRKKTSPNFDSQRRNFDINGRNFDEENVYTLR